MGWQIVRKISPNTRLWKLEEVHDFVKKNRELKEIEAMVVPNKQANVHQKLGFGADIFESMNNLRLLDVYRKFTSCEPTILPHELRWLSWHQYPFSSLPLADECELVGLEMHGGNIEHLWNGRKIMLNLKFIHLQQLECLTKFPDISGAPNVERLVLASCRNLVEVHESLGYHKTLAYLSLSNCWKLKFFPERIEMESLETLILSRCSSLERFPEVMPCMLKLSNICLDGCLRIKQLPSSIRHLCSLSFLNLTRCTSLTNLPECISKLNCLKSIHLHDCVKLLTLPEDFGSMKNLEELQLGFTDPNRLPRSTNFHTLQNLHSLRKLDLSGRQTEDLGLSGLGNVDAFSSLEELNLSGNSELIELPAIICHLSHLKHLELNECYRLQNLHSLPSNIQVLKASDCCSLEMIEDLPEKYEWLYKVWLVGCWKLPDQEDEINPSKMLQLPFLEKCAAVGHRLSIAIPGCKIPSWFDAEQDGCDITLKLPPGWHSRIMGFAISGVFSRMWNIRNDYPVVTFTVVDEGGSVPMTEFDDSNEVSPFEIDTVWTGYIPFRYFQPMGDDWSDMEVNVAISVRLQTGQLPVKCGVHIVNNDDVESIQPNTTYISDYCNSDCVSRFGNSFIYEDELRNI
uniref:disease resistance protein TAO1-like n=1 Tax=Erigeron canadensis TaxID=72917 RepID=UPI001CB8CF72|nr:disease resistance protein TAO1-like [Erigeron canadensis]